MKTKIGTFRRLLGIILVLGTLLTAGSSLISCKGETVTEADVKEVVKDYITGSWQQARVKDCGDTEGTKMSTADYSVTDGKWLKATVPGTVLTSYYDNGMIDDPYFGTNMKTLEESGYYNCDYWYRTEFNVDESYSGSRTWLNFDGINWKADVYVNGKSVGNIAGAFIRGKFDITDFIKVGKTNYLAVYIHWSDSGDKDMPTFYCSAGWDTMPPIAGRNMGIYKDVYLSRTADVTIDNPFVKVDLPLPDTKSAKLDVSAEVTNCSSSPATGKLVCEIKSNSGSEGMTFEKEITVAGKTTDTVTLDTATLANPLLWWPNGYGDQNLYTCTLSFVSGDVASDKKETTFGVREFEYDTSTLTDMIVSCNGVKIFCNGGCWCIPEAMLSWNSDDFDTAIRYQADMGLTMVRCWHGTCDFDAFYDACDKYGIMVFDDFWLNGQVRPDDVDMFMNNVVDKVKRVRNHACMAVWCGENEATPPAPLNTKIPKAISEFDGTRLYIDASNADEVSGGVTYSIQNPGWYFDQANGFTTEIGCVSVPNAESMIRMMGKTGVWPVGNDLWQFHDYDADIGNKLPEKYTSSVNGRYGNSTNIYEFCKKSQLLNYETFRAIYEAWNDRMWSTTSGLLLWMSNPAWPSTIWQTYDYYMEQNGAFFGTKTANEMQHIQWNYSTGSVKVINKKNDAIPGVTAKAEIYNLDGTLAFTKTHSFDVSANSAVEAFTVFANTGVNLAATRTAEASSTAKGSESAMRAADGKSDTRWAAKDGGDQWLKIDMGQIQSIDRVEIDWENAYASAFRVELSTDGSTWVTVDSVSNAFGGTTTHSFTATSARFIRIFCTRQGTMYPYSIYEVRGIQAGTTNTEDQALTDVHFIKLRLTDSTGKLISENFYWRSKSNNDYTSINSLSKATLGTLVSKEDSEEGRTKISLTLQNQSSQTALVIRVNATRDNAGAEEDNRILPCEYSDNYFSLLAGESKTVEIEFDSDSLSGGNPVISLEGYNVDAFSVPVA